MFLVRIGFAAIMMFPLTSGFSTGQAAVVQAAAWGIGMANAVYANAVQAIGPDSMVIAQPMIPGTETIVLNLMQDELCRALVNAAIRQPKPRTRAHTRREHRSRRRRLRHLVLLAVPRQRDRLGHLRHGHHPSAEPERHQHRRRQHRHDRHPTGHPDPGATR